MPEERIQWHPAFATALKLELKDYYPEVLDIQEEYQLTSKPLEVDILVVRKIKEAKILLNIAQLFKGHNIIEYKSPEDYLSVDDYYKVKAYAYLYKTLGERVDSIKVEDMTITMVSSKFPKKMAEHLEKHQQLTVTKQDDGIYYINGDDILSQFIVVDELPKRQNRYIRLLTTRMSIKEEISMLIKEFSSDPKNSMCELLFETVTASNLMQIMEVYNMARKLSNEEMEALDKVVMKFNLNKKWEEKGEVLSLLRILNKKFAGLPDEIAKKIQQTNDKKIINSIFDNIFEIESLEDLEKFLK